MAEKKITVEYDEQHVPHGELLEIFAEDVADVRILDATPVGGEGGEVRWRYVVLWENGS